MYDNAQYIAQSDTQQEGIRVEINGVQSFVPLDSSNFDYSMMMQLVDDGKLVIAPAG